MTQSFLTGLVILAAALSLSACPSGGGPAGSSGDAAKGKTHYAAACATCHGTSAEGVTGLGKKLTGNAFVASQTDDQILVMINEGRPADHPANTTRVAMPPKGGNPGLTEADIRDIVAYLRSL